MNVSLILDFECFVLKEFGTVYRQLGWLAVNSDTCELVDIYTPGIYYSNLSIRDKKTVWFLTNRLHGLKLLQKPTNNFSISADEVESYLLNLHSNYPGLFGYKGGCFERDLLHKLEIPAVNLETLGCPKSKDIAAVCKFHKYFKEHCGLCDVMSYKNWLK
jgi:hypothetical protein